MLEKMIEKLNGDLSNELSHWLFYMHHGTNVSGLHREEISEFLLEAAKSEMAHIEQFQRLIIGLGGVPTIHIAPIATGLSDPKEILSEALKMELRVVENYVQRIEDARVLQERVSTAVDGKYIELFLEDQILDSRGDADNIKQMLL
jgi:bacterioferritin (cytochrome b1)